MSNFKVWAEVEPPKGTVYNYPIRPWHDARILHHRLVRPAGYRGADVEPRTIPTMVAKLVAGAVDPAVDRLGEERTGRLHAARRGRRKLAIDHGSLLSGSST